MKKIVVGLDGSKRQATVLAAAVKLAGVMDAELVLLRAVGLPPEVPQSALTMTPDQLTRALEEQAGLDLQAVRATLPANVTIRLRTVLGTPWHVICDVAKEEHADLIVLGTHGHSTLELIIGTTCGKVVNHAPCSVFVQRDPS